MKSPHGRRGSICAHFHWTYDYLMHDIPWGTVQRMLIDAPRYDDKDEEEIHEEFDTTEDLVNAINQLAN